MDVPAVTPFQIENGLVIIDCEAFFRVKLRGMASVFSEQLAYLEQGRDISVSSCIRTIRHSVNEGEGEASIIKGGLALCALTTANPKLARELTRIVDGNCAEFEQYFFHFVARAAKVLLNAHESDFNHLRFHEISSILGLAVAPLTEVLSNAQYARYVTCYAAWMICSEAHTSSLTSENVLGLLLGNEFGMYQGEVPHFIPRRAIPAESERIAVNFDNYADADTMMWRLLYLADAELFDFITLMIDIPLRFPDHMDNPITKYALKNGISGVLTLLSRSVSNLTPVVVPDQWMPLIVAIVIRCFMPAPPTALARRLSVRDFALHHAVSCCSYFPARFISDVACVLSNTKKAFSINVIEEMKTSIPLVTDHVDLIDHNTDFDAFSGVGDTIIMGDEIRTPITVVRYLEQFETTIIDTQQVFSESRFDKGGYLLGYFAGKVLEAMFPPTSWHNNILCNTPAYSNSMAYLKYVLSLFFGTAIDGMIPPISAFRADRYNKCERMYDHIRSLSGLESFPHFADWVILVLLSLHHYFDDCIGLTLKWANQGKGYASLNHSSGHASIIFRLMSHVELRRIFAHKIHGVGGVVNGCPWAMLIVFIARSNGSVLMLQQHQISEYTMHGAINDMGSVQIATGSSLDPGMTMRDLMMQPESASVRHLYIRD